MFRIMSPRPTPPPGLDIVNPKVMPSARGWEGGCGPWQRRHARTFPTEATVIAPGSRRLLGPSARTVLPLPSVPRAGRAAAGRRGASRAAAAGYSRVCRRLTAGGLGVSRRAPPEGRFPSSPLTSGPAAGAPASPPPHPRAPGSSATVLSPSFLPPCGHRGESSATSRSWLPGPPALPLRQWVPGSCVDALRLGGREGLLFEGVQG